MRVFVTGATGLIGRALCADLAGAGHRVLALSRGATSSPLPGVEVLRGDPTEAGPWQQALAGCDACVNLAGEPVSAGRWTPERRARIRESRVRSAARVAEVVAAGGPRVLVQGSAVGVYGDRGEEPLGEGAPAGTGFLAEVSVAWEAAAAPAARRARLVLLRTGIVLDGAGGALPRMALPFKLLAGGPIGDGRFWQPWIHRADEVGLIAWALGEGRVEGPLNGAAPGSARNRDLARAIGKALHRPSLLPTPSLMVRLAVGEMAEVVLASQRVVPEKALALGYRFRFPDVEPALADLLR